MFGSKKSTDECYIMNEHLNVSTFVCALLARHVSKLGIRNCVHNFYGLKSHFYFAVLSNQYQLSDVF